MTEVSALYFLYFSTLLGFCRSSNFAFLTCHSLAETLPAGELLRWQLAPVLPVSSHAHASWLPPKTYLNVPWFIPASRNKTLTKNSTLKCPWHPAFRIRLRIRNLKSKTRNSHPKARTLQSWLALIQFSHSPTFGLSHSFQSYLTALSSTTFQAYSQTDTATTRKSIMHFIFESWTSTISWTLNPLLPTLQTALWASPELWQTFVNFCRLLPNFAGLLLFAVLGEPRQQVVRLLQNIPFE